ncbi:hypothetical protein EVAR_55828_1 [Eumeta japonica]|uniref:Uncharacterized protein n=1 Tax=Eumeta variegata TaxID=151549 RepID=A0A4C1YXP6_EUMVA|nr:hypothetical protein EVAR_55828_1 [Eumeta japonica]
MWFETTTPVIVFHPMRVSVTLSLPLPLHQTLFLPNTMQLRVYMSDDDHLNSGGWVPYLKRKKRNPYRITLLSVCPSVRPSVKTLFLRNAWRYEAEIYINYSGLLSLEAVKNQTSKPTQSKDTAVYAANFRHLQGNQNLQGASRELRILKFGTKQRLIA